jgi:hypothetical protein
MNTSTQGAKIMRNLVYPTLMIIAAAALSSCSNPPAAVVNPFVGSYTGTFLVTTGNQDAGTLAVTVANDGSLSGTITLTTRLNNPSTSVSGSILSDGNTTVNYKYSGGTFEAVTLKGKLSIDNKKVSGELGINTATVADGGKAKIDLIQK